MNGFSRIDKLTHRFALVASRCRGEPEGGVVMVTPQSALITPHSLRLPGSLWPCCPCCLCDRESTHLSLEDADHGSQLEPCHPLTGTLGKHLASPCCRSLTREVWTLLPSLSALGSGSENLMKQGMTALLNLFDRNPQ